MIIENRDLTYLYIPSKSKFMECYGRARVHKFLKSSQKKAMLKSTDL